MASHGKSTFKYTEHEVHVRVYRAGKKGISPKVIALEFNVPLSTVYRLMKKEPKYEV